MKSELSNARRGDVGHEPTELELLEDPLEFIKEDHMHMRAVCETMDRIAAAAAPDAVAVTDVIRVLEHEIGLLIRDEDDDLRALLLERCTQEDDIEATLARLCEEHRELARQLPDLLQALHAVQDERRAMSAAEADAVRRFSAGLRRHLIVENAIVLPIAKARLTAEDLSTLRGGMIWRRIEDMQG